MISSHNWQQGLICLFIAKSRPLHFSIPTAETWTPVFPQLFGANPSWELFGRQVFRLSNKQDKWHYEEDDAWFLNWIGISADFALLRAFFSINGPTAGAVYECLLWKTQLYRKTQLLRVLFELRQVLSPDNSTSFNKVEFLSAAVRIGSRSCDILDIVNTCLSNKPPFSITTQYDLMDWASSSVLEAASRCDIAILRVLVDAGLKVDRRVDIPDPTESFGQIMSHIYNWDPQDQDSLSDYIQILLRGGVLDGNASLQFIDDHRTQDVDDPYAIWSITWDELVMACPPSMRKDLQMAFTSSLRHQGSHISIAGVFTVAQDGAIRLLAYLEAHQDNDSFLTRVILEECLVFTAFVNDSKTAAVLLEVGVDPHVGSLSKNLNGDQKGDLPWNPSAVAAAAGNLEVLTLLLGHIDLSSFLDFAPFHQLLHGAPLWTPEEQSGMESRLGRLSSLRRSCLDAQPRSPKLAAEGNMNGSIVTLNRSERRFETLEYIRSIAHSQNFGQKVDLEIIKAALRRMSPVSRCADHIPCDALLIKGLVDGHLEYQEEGMDLLHLSIRNHCRFPVVSLLSAKGFKVHSNPGGQDRNSMLHDALLSQSPDRSIIVEFLLEEGADCKVCGEGLTILEASLWNRSFGKNLESLRIFERLLNSGASVHQWPRKRLERWKPLICLLLDARASDDLILRVVDVGAPLNALSYGSRDDNLTPLQAALDRKRERLARELIRRGADVHAPAHPMSGLTALQAACSSSLPTQLVEYLVAVLGVKVDEPPAKNKGLTSLAGAVDRGSLNTVEFLLNRGADVNATCRYYIPVFPDNCNPRVRPLDLAVYNGNLDMVELLLKAGGRSREAGLGGAIRIAAKKGHFAVLSVLRSWDKKHRRRILEEEAIWQSQNPEQVLVASMFSKVHGEYLLQDFDSNDDE